MPAHTEDTREHAQAIRALDRRSVDLPAGAGADCGPRSVRAPYRDHRSDFRFVVAEQLRERGIEADIVRRCLCVMRYLR